MGGISIKREIGHLCHDERRPRVGEKPTVATPAPQGSVELSRTYPARMCIVIPSEIVSYIISVPVYQTQAPQPSSAWPMAYMYQPGTFGNEFAVLTCVRIISFLKDLAKSTSNSDFLETLDDGTFFSPPTTVAPSLVSSSPFGPTNATASPPPSTTPGMPSGQLQAALLPTPSSHTVATPTIATTNPMASTESASAEAILPSATKTERFLLTAADQESGSRDERLNRVIRSKYEAGLLKPYNYVKGYARLSRWMDRKYVIPHYSHNWMTSSCWLISVSQESKQQILQPLSVLRPKFRVSQPTFSRTSSC